MTEKYSLEKQRFPEIDALKCACILAVVYIHSISTSFEPKNPLGIFFADFTRFAVPGLFFAAGFLFDKKEGATGAIIKKKLLRLLPPYLFCSLCFQFLNVPGLNVRLENLHASLLIRNLIFCDTLGIYYYIFVLLYLFAFALVFRKMPDKWVLALWGLSALLLLAFVKGQIGFAMSSMFLIIRHPCFHLFGFLSGWVFSLYYKPVGSLLRQYPKQLICGGLFLIVAILGYTRMNGNFSSFPVLTQVFIYTWIAVLVTAGMKAAKLQGAVQFISNCSYGIYLLHLPVVRACQSFYPELSSDYTFGVALVSWCGGLAGSILIIRIVQKISGPYSRYLVGC
jgi:peptidoglycan/LPS O-acetylase OafA/YrhL